MTFINVSTIVIKMSIRYFKLYPKASDEATEFTLTIL